jgi:predicted membrane channel-forming protein YqfA (hemolysin III family)
MPELALFAEAIAGLVVIEFVALAWWRNKKGRGPRPFDIALHLSAGLCLLLAMSAGLRGEPEIMLAMLAASGLAHLADLVRFWKKA